MSMSSISAHARKQYRDQKHIKHVQKGKINAPVRVPIHESQVILLIKNNNVGKSTENKNLLNQLGLRWPWSAVFLANTPENWKICKQLKAHILYGCPNLDIISHLIHKNGRLWKNEERDGSELNSGVSLDDVCDCIKGNKAIEDKMGLLGVVCLEDLVSEVF